MKEIKRSGAGFWILFSMAILSACQPNQPPQPAEEVRLQLKWLHQPQFAGFYMAQEKGYYARENLKVTFLEGGPTVEIGDAVLKGQADFGVLSPDDLLLQRSQGKPLTALAAIYRRSAVVFAARADSGIVRPDDFIGKTVAARGEGGSREFLVQLSAMMKQVGLDPAGMTIVPFDPSYKDFLAGKVQVTACYATSGLIRLRNQGLKLNLIRPDDYKVHFYSDTLFASEERIAQKPDLVLRFLRASLKGWQEAVEDYPRAIEITKKYAPNLPPELQTAMMEAMLPLVHTGEERIGWMRPEVWRGMRDILAEQGLLKGPVEVERAYTLRFLQEVYGVKNP